MHAQIPEENGKKRDQSVTFKGQRSPAQIKGLHDWFCTFPHELLMNVWCFIARTRVYHLGCMKSEMRAIQSDLAVFPHWHKWNDSLVGFSPLLPRKPFFLSSRKVTECIRARYKCRDALTLSHMLPSLASPFVYCCCFQSHLLPPWVSVLSWPSAETTRLSFQA